MAGLKAITQYEQVRKRVEGGVTVGQAIREVAKDMGISAGTVHTSYYRVARDTGVLRGRTNRSFNRSKANGGSQNGRMATADLMERVTEAVTALAMHCEALERDSSRLRQIEHTLAEAS